MEGVAFSQQERRMFALRALYERRGYRKYAMSRFEELGLYLDNRYFLASDRVISFTDTDGRLLALKPDVTLSIVKGARGLRTETERLYYAESVFRPGREGEGFQEISQMGVERLGVTDGAALSEIVSLALVSLRALSPEGRLTVNHMGFALSLLDAIDARGSERAQALSLLSQKNAHGLAELLGEQRAAPLAQALSLCGDAKTVLPAARALVQNSGMAEALDRLETLAAEAGDITLDLTALNDAEYYNGVVLSGYLPGVPRPVLAGGQYDGLMRKFQKQADGVGFAVYLDALSAPARACDGMLTVALPKGRLGDSALAALGLSPIPESDRRLSWEEPTRGLRFLMVKPSDVAVYVARGAADVGVVGKDTLLEQQPDVYELLDLGIGKCRMCVAAPEGFQEDEGRALRVATKFPRIAKAHFAARGREIDVIKLNGSIELAPLLSLSDVIVDIVESGRTLRENHLQVLETFLPVSARLIAGKAGYVYKNARIRALMNELGGRGQ